MNRANFRKWVTEKLIPNIREPSIIVMDNAPYHSVVKNKCPTSANKVDEIKMWLLENNIPFDLQLRKPSLVQLVKKHKPDPIYEIDELLGQHGHTVVRLPPYHCDLNPIELIWAQAKRKIASQNVGAKNIKELALDAFNSITREDWKNCCDHVKKIEMEYYNRGKTLYEDIEKFIIHVGDETSEDDSDSDSCYSAEEPNDDTEDAPYPLASTSKQSDDQSFEGVEYLDFDELY
ncbi:unnamed protein product [Colias eurytheme]|nr:unnamed protein product [Colias eurytheme]